MALLKRKTKSWRRFEPLNKISASQMRLCWRQNKQMMQRGRESFWRPLQQAHIIVERGSLDRARKLLIWSLPIRKWTAEFYVQNLLCPTIQARRLSIKVTWSP